LTSVNQGPHKVLGGAVHSSSLEHGVNIARRLHTGDSV